MYIILKDNNRLSMKFITKKTATLYKKYNRFIVLVDDSLEISNLGLTPSNLIDTHNFD